MHAKNASPVKWCLNEKVELLCNLAMLTFVARACWAPTDRGGQHRPKAGKKKKTREAGLFFLVPTSPRCFIRKWVNPTFPDL